jgi:hypothetical protein
MECLNAEVCRPDRPPMIAFNWLRSLARTASPIGSSVGGGTGRFPSAIGFARLIVVLSLGGTACDTARVHSGQWRPGQWPTEAPPASEARAPTATRANTTNPLMSPVEIVTGQVKPTEVVVSNGSLFWIDAGDSVSGGRVCRAPAAEGGEATVLASGLASPLDLAVDETHVYFVTAGTADSPKANGAVSSVPIAGGRATTLVSSAANPQSIAVDKSFVYFTTTGGDDSRRGAVSRVSKRGGTVKVIASAQDNPRQLEVDAGMVLWVELGLRHAGGHTDSRLHEWPTDGGPARGGTTEPTSLRAIGSSIERFALVDGVVLFVNDGQLVGITRGKALARDRGLDGVRLVASDGETLFALTDPGVLVRYAERGLERSVALAVLPPAGGLAVDDAFVYATDLAGGRILRIPKVSVEGGQGSRADIARPTGLQ